ncbi:spermidine/putrescine ABC transporter membrane protein [Weissella viridescens]|nr:spermidine/putrescine ABC transporter membrane protein [Weissella viridescens]
MKKLKPSYLYLAFVFALMYLPIFYLMFYSFNAGSYMNGFAGFSLKHYATLFSDYRLMGILANTFIIALLSGLFATLIGTFGALAIYRTRRIGLKNTLLSLNNILIVSPDVIIGASF